MTLTKRKAIKMNTPNSNIQSSANNSKGGTHQKPNDFTAYEANKLAQESIAKALQSANPHLVPATNNGLITASKNIRIELKRAFPKIKFQVRSERFAGGDAIRVSWLDGVTVEDVEAITSKYKAGHFDGSTDYYDYNSTAWTEAFGDTKYISTSRDYSPEFINQIIKEIGDKFHDGELPTAEEYKKGLLYSQSPTRHCDTWQQLIYRTMYKTAH
jgi:hypothetical protein